MYCVHAVVVCRQNLDCGKITVWSSLADRLTRARACVPACAGVCALQPLSGISHHVRERERERARDTSGEGGLLK